MGRWIRGNRYVSRVVQPAKNASESAAKKAITKGVDVSKNINRGKRPRIGATVSIPEVEKVFTQKVVNMPKPQGFQPYYISLGDPNPVLSAEQNQERLAKINKSINELGQHIKRQSDIYGIETPATHKAAMYRAVKTDPQATTTLPEGEYRLPYHSGAQMYEGAPLSEWFDLASQGMIPHGPNALWRKWEQPLKDATNSWDVIGQLRGVGAPAPEMSLQQLGEGLKQMGHYLGITPPRKPYISPLTTIRNPYVTPETNVVSNFIGPDMGPGIYGYRIATNEWWPLSKRSADAAAGNIEKYSMFGAIGEKQHLPQQISNRHNVIERGYTFEGYPFVIRANRNPENFKFRVDNDTSGPADWANSGSGSWKVKGHEQGGVILAKSGIHIKKKNRGKFTSWCGGKVTSECIARGKRSSNPAVRKRATFAANSRKWAKKHQNGGTIIPMWALKLIQK